MTRGNQRELARQKNAKKSTDQTKGRRTDGLSAAARKQRDAEIMQQKQQAAAKEGQSAPKESGLWRNSALYPAFGMKRLCSWLLQHL
uniref:Small EDRK-rich factor 2-like n=1 Tax=Callorhinchus milii TaxID=7868 RepID=A0A4W3GQC6_CALMI